VKFPELPEVAECSPGRAFNTDRRLHPKCPEQGSECYALLSINLKSYGQHALSRDGSVISAAALTLALVGDHAGAENLLGEPEGSQPSNTQTSLRAAMEVNKGNAAQALSLLEILSPRELWWGLQPAYLRGKAYLVAHNGEAAAAEFQKLLRYRGLFRHELIGAMAHLQLGRAYALTRDTTKAKMAYQDFLTLSGKTPTPTSPC
jgi:hypothetical protein